ncbi:MAG: antibiotic biosynthesis monooxygenase [Deltaproteobacteria bacterium]|nr:antibiotic biosynthesis monooxygenase [Deltaproteobacteria bacterium]
MSEAGAGSNPVSATVVIAQHVRPGKEQDYLGWQAEVNEKCRTFPGFEAAEVVPPVLGIQDDFVVVYRFDTAEHLSSWLRSEIRRSLLARGETLFTGEARQHVIAGGRPAENMAGMVVSTRVKPGREKAYREWQGMIDAEAARFSGFLGNEVFAPVPGVQEDWVVAVRFDSAEHLKDWLQSESRLRLIEQAADLWQEARVESFSGGFPGWFGHGADGSGRAADPPNWKQAMSVLLVLYPTVMLLNLFLSPLLTGLPAALSMFIGNVASVVLLTWLLMSMVNRVFGFWLTPSPSRPFWVEVMGVVAMLLGYALSVIIFERLG